MIKPVRVNEQTNLEQLLSDSLAGDLTRMSWPIELTPDPDSEHDPELDKLLEDPELIEDDEDEDPEDDDDDDDDDLE